MRKTSIIIFILCLISIFSCKYELEDIDSTLIVNNLPDGEYYVSVYPTNIPNEDLKEKYNNSTGFIALANGNSPFRLIWYETISSGDRFVIIRKYLDNSTDIIKINIASFTKEGDATLDWNDMIDFDPYKK